MTGFCRAPGFRWCKICKYSVRGSIFNFKITTLIPYFESQFFRVWSIHSSLYHMLPIHYVSFTTWAPYNLKKLLHSRFPSVFLDIGGSLDNKSVYSTNQRRQLWNITHVYLQWQLVNILVYCLIYSYNVYPYTKPNRYTTNISIINTIW